MKTFKITAITLVVITLTLFPKSVFARKGELSSPQIALQRNIPEKQRKQILQVLDRKDCNFVGGSWVNSFTRLHYRGNVEALEGFIDALSKCPGVKVTVGFQSKEKTLEWAPKNSNWTVFHMPTNGNSFIITVHLDSDINISSLNIPIQNQSSDSKKEKQMEKIDQID